MKLLTKEEEREHYRETVKGGTIAGVICLAIGGAGVYAAQRRYPMFAATTTPFKVFLAASCGSIGAILQADRSSRAYDARRNPMKHLWKKELEQKERAIRESKTHWERTKEWAGKNRYPIVFGSWVASMGVAGAIVSRNKYLTAPQKLVQARVYAQGLTLAVLLTSFAFEASDATKGEGRWETVKVLDPNDPTHTRFIEKKVHLERYAGEDLWKDMVEAEERRIAARKKATDVANAAVAVTAPAAA